MEIVSENFDLQVCASSHQTPNQQTYFENEDISLVSEVAVERSGIVEIEKTLVIQKKFIVNEKILVPQQSLMSPQNQFLMQTQASCIDANAIPLYCPENSIMEIASQESLDSVMDISSQESHLSPMEFSSQGSDAPVGESCVPNKETATSENQAPIRPANDLPAQKGNLEEVSNIESPPLPQEDVSDIKDDKEEGILKQNDEDNGDCETVQQSEVSYSKSQASIASDDRYVERKLSTKRSLLSREKAISAREAACMSREKAIEEREAALANQGTILKETSDDDLHSPKRLKLIGVFEYR